jgi:aminopeptidase N
MRAARLPHSVVLAALFCAAQAPAVGEAQPRPQARFSFYELRLGVDASASSLRGCVRAVGRAAANSSVKSISFDLASSMIVDSATATVGRGRSRLDIAHHASQLILVRSTPWSSGELIDVTTCYHGAPSKDAVAFIGSGDSARIASYGLPRSAREWWPSEDDQVHKVDSVDIAITAPEALTAVSNGRQVARSANGDGTATTRWSVRYPIYPDVVSIAIAKYVAFSLPYRTINGQDLPLEFFVFPEDEVKARTDFSSIPSILAHHEARFGPYPFPREKYGIAEFPIESFREHQTIPSLGPHFITGTHVNDWILAHEVAHQWFGNSLTVQSWSDAWLNEGFATYAAWLWIERTNGRAAYDSIIAERVKPDFPHAVHVADTLDFDKMFDRVTFSKGALVLHMLRHVVGDDAFFRALRKYATENAYGHVTTASFRSICERESGRPLRWFFDEWISRSGEPSYSVEWSQHRAAGGFAVRVVLSQRQDSSTFTMPVDVLLRTSRGASARTISDTARMQVSTYFTRDSVIDVSIDPGHWILKRHPHENPSHK